MRRIGCQSPANSQAWWYKMPYTSNFSTDQCHRRSVSNSICNQVPRGRECLLSPCKRINRIPSIKNTVGCSGNRNSFLRIFFGLNIAHLGRFPFARCSRRLRQHALLKHTQLPAAHGCLLVLAVECLDRIRIAVMESRVRMIPKWSQRPRECNAKFALGKSVIQIGEPDVSLN